MLCYELACLETAEKFICIASYIAGIYFINHDLAFRVYNEASSFCHSVRFDQHFKILAECVGRICQHWISDLTDSFRGIMPCFVDKMGVCRNRVDFAASSLEIRIFILQILQLGRAYKGKVGRIEEKYAPFSQNIGLGHGFKLPILISLNRKITYFFIDH